MMIEELEKLRRKYKFWIKCDNNDMNKIETWKKLTRLIEISSFFERFLNFRIPTKACLKK
jgi:hypothetical protein